MAQLAKGYPIRYHRTGHEFYVQGALVKLLADLQEFHWTSSSGPTASRPLEWSFSKKKFCNDPEIDHLRAPKYKAIVEAYKEFVRDSPDPVRERKKRGVHERAVDVCANAPGDPILLRVPPWFHSFWKNLGYLMFEALRERVLTKKGWRNLCSLWDKFEYFPPAIEQPILRLDDAVSHHNLISGTRWMQSALVLPAILGELPLEAANFLDHHIPRLVHDKGPLLEPFSQFAHLVCLFFCGSLSENEAKAVEHLYREHMRTKAVWFGDFFANRPCNVSGLEIARCIRLFGSLNFQKEDLWEGVFKESKRILAHSSHKWQPLVLMNRIRFRASVELLAAGKMYQSEGRLYPSGTAWAKFFHLLPCCNPPLPNESPTPLLHGRIRHPSEAQMEARIRLLQSCGRYFPFFLNR